MFSTNDEIVYIGCQGTCGNRLKPEECGEPTWIGTPGTVIDGIVDDNGKMFIRLGAGIGENKVRMAHFRLKNPVTEEDAKKATPYSPDILKNLKDFHV